MRRLLALLLVPLLFLAACGGEDSNDDSASGGSFDDVTVSGDVGKKPTIEGAEGVTVDEITTKVLVEGDGEEVADGDTVDIRYVLIQAKDDTEMGSTFGQESGTTTTLDSETDPVLAANLVGQKIGTRVLIGLRTSDIAGQEAGEAADDTLLVVADLVSAWEPPKVTGTIADVKVSDGPLKKKPTITLSEKPLVVKDTQSKVLVKGKGAKVKDGDTVTVRYLGVNGRDGKEFDTSWGGEDGDTTDFPITSGQMIPGFVEGLVGQTIGSRVLISMPYTDGYGTGGSAGAGIQAGDSLVFVVDLVKPAKGNG
ncbi:peptidylprolyl isomerase [Mumia flava]|uniref:Peptidyl-prolyl cis-trans isomerase n=1 Tax=Mumia flava TaxID=1348852 RepID=A0A2M9B6B3_9ACTN|nr:peptidylprolyl isomerase [Mumia flava]